MARSVLGQRYPKVKNERLAKALERTLVERGPVPIALGGRAGWVEYELATKYGPLRISRISPSKIGPGVWVYMAFEKPNLATAGGLLGVNPHSGKWNQIFQEDVKIAVADFNKLLDLVDARDPRDESGHNRSGRAGAKRNVLRNEYESAVLIDDRDAGLTIRGFARTEEEFRKNARKQLSPNMRLVGKLRVLSRSAIKQA